MKTPPIPNIFPREQYMYLRDLSLYLMRSFSGLLSRDTPTDQIILRSSGNKDYAVTVKDDGTIETTLVQE